MNIMGCVAKVKKVKISKMLLEDLLVYLLTRYVLYLRGEEMFKFNGEPVDKTVAYHEDGTFVPTEQGIADTFKFMDDLWQQQIRHRVKKEAWPKYIELFKQSVAKEWKASKNKSGSTATGSQS